MFLLVDCASIFQDKDTIAVVDGESITKGDLQYTLQVAHRRENLSSASILDIKGYVQKLIDERLIVQEAQRMGLEETPEVQQKVDAYILRESVVKLYNEEIIQKVSVSEEEIKDYYREYYKEFFLALIESESEEDAEGLLEQLRNGADFSTLVHEYSTHSSKENDGEIRMKFREMAESIREVVTGMQPGGISEVVKAGHKYYIVKLISWEEAPDEGLDAVKNNIEEIIKKQKTEERSNEYLAYLREKSAPKVDREIMDSINFNADKEEREKWLKDERPLVEVRGHVLTTGQFVAMVPSNKIESAEKILNSWIDHKVVDIEALSRQYDTKTDLADMVRRYTYHNLKKEFIRKALLPKIEVSEDEMKEYYTGHQEDFLAAVYYKIQKITVKTEEEAQDILKSLQGGADFTWMAKKKSADNYASKGGVMEAVVKELLPAPVQEIVDTLNPGDFSPVLAVDHNYMIARLLKKSEQTVKSFDSVKQKIHKKVFQEKYDKLYKNYIDTLKKDANIKINEELVQSFNEAFRK